jgi:hypothetical protein
MKTPDQKSKEDLALTQTPPDRGRRRLVQSGIGAAPLLMTLVSRPVLGQVTCQTTSAALSMPTSHAHGQLPVCSGGSPSFWSQNLDKWPAGYYPTSTEAGTLTLSAATGSTLSQQATLFAPPFLPSPYAPDTTLLTVLQNPGDAVAQHLAAALLNVASGWVPVLNEAMLQTIWLEYTSKGYFEPTAGVQWYSAEIVSYLTTTETK